MPRHALARRPRPRRARVPLLPGLIGEGRGGGRSRPLPASRPAVRLPTGYGLGKSDWVAARLAQRRRRSTVRRCDRPRLSALAPLPLVAAWSAAVLAVAPRSPPRGVRRVGDPDHAPHAGGRGHAHPGPDPDPGPQRPAGRERLRQALPADDHPPHRQGAPQGERTPGRWTRHRSWARTGSTASRSGSPTGGPSAPSGRKGPTDRQACELWRSGIAKDTGQPGPTWTVTLKDGTTSYCTGPTGPCEHHPAGPFSVRAFKGGLYRDLHRGRGVRRGGRGPGPVTSFAPVERPSRGVVRPEGDGMRPVTRAALLGLALATAATARRARRRPRSCRATSAGSSTRTSRGSRPSATRAASRS